jgi:hypothetical protein
MTDSIYDYVIQALEDSKGEWPEVSEGSGVALTTLKKIARKEVANPGVHYIERLWKYFQLKDQARRSSRAKTESAKTIS